MSDEPANTLAASAAAAIRDAFDVYHESLGQVGLVEPNTAWPISRGLTALPSDSMTPESSAPSVNGSCWTTAICPVLTRRSQFPTPQA